MIVFLKICCEKGSCLLRVDSFLAPAVIAQGDPNDPRNAAGKDRSLIISSASVEGALMTMEQKTKNSGFSVCCAVMPAPPARAIQTPA